MRRRLRLRGWAATVGGGLGLVLAVGALPGSAASASTAVPVTAKSAPTTSEKPTGPQALKAASSEEALDLAERSGQRVEILSMRGERSEAYATPDGNIEAVEHLRPVRARVGGEWKSVDTTLQAGPDGTLSPRVATVGLSFSAGGDAELATLRTSGRVLGMSWPTSLPTPRIEGDTAVYPDVLPDVDLRLQADVDGFSQLLVVKTAEAAANPALAELRMGVEANAVKVRETAAGGLEAVDNGEGGTVFETPSPVMWDSSAAAKPALVELELAKAGDELLLTPDQSVLTGTDTVYPVYIAPQFHSSRATAWTTTSRHRTDSAQWLFRDRPDATTARCDRSQCELEDTQRFFYTIPTSRFAGKTILNAEFVVQETHSASCTRTPVELWRTRTISPSTTWNSQLASGFWIDKLDSRDYALGSTGCRAGDAEFEVDSMMRRAAARGWSSVTLGLKAGDESDPLGRKRFGDDAFLRVTYNLPPSQVRASQLAMNPGGTCQGPDSVPVVSTRPRLRASNVTDPDKGRVAVQFQVSWKVGDAWTGRWTSPLSVKKPSGSDFSVDLPSTVPTEVPLRWQTRVSDTHGLSLWSQQGADACYFTVRTDALPEPTVTSADYPESDTAGPNDQWMDGVGRYATFTIDSPSTDVVKYWYGIDNYPSPYNVVPTTGGEPRDIRFLINRSGSHFVTARSFDSAGRFSDSAPYYFDIGSGQPSRATWQMDDVAGATQAVGTGSPRTAELAGGATPGAEGILGKALLLDGVDDYARASVPVVDTTGGFSVSAWVNLSAAPDGDAVVAAQHGVLAPGFELSYVKASNAWAFTRYARDAPAVPVRAVQPQPTDITPGSWTHLVGTYDAGAHELRLYVNGALVASTPYDAPVESRGGLFLGAGPRADTRAGGFLPGLIDEVHLYDRPVSADEVTQLHAKQRLPGPARPAVAVFPLDEDAAATTVTGNADVLPAVYHGGATPGRPGIIGNALGLDGVDDRAVIGAPHIDTAQSFTFSVWAKLDATKPDHSGVVLTQTGTHQSGGELFYSAYHDKWMFNQHDSDTPGAASHRVVQDSGPAPQGGEWTHLVGIHDAVADTLSLYVNGEPAGTTTLTTPWSAAGPLQIGAGSYSGTPGNFFPGDIDDLRLFGRPLTTDEIAKLFRQQPVIKGRWKLDEVTTATPPTTPDDSTYARRTTLYGGATIGTGRVDTGALNLTNGTGYAATAGGPGNTAGSFTVTAWARPAAGTPDGPMTVLSQQGDRNSSIAIRYVTEGGPHWEATMASDDTASATVVTVGNAMSARTGEWTHLAVVYDAYHDKLSLYVNGELGGVWCRDDNGDGKPDDPLCHNQDSWASNVKSFNARTSLQLGRRKHAGVWSEPWAGSIDDVWTFQGTLTQSQIVLLCAGMPGLPTEVPQG